MALGATILSARSRTLQSYYALQTVLSATLFTLLWLLEPGALAALLFISAVVIQVALFEPYPRSLMFSVAVVTISSALFALQAMEQRGALLERIETALLVFVATLGVAVTGCLMSRYRELAVAQLDKVAQLEHSVVELARANTTFQEYAVDASEQGAETERLRITRDIHDIVGYTLTNNMMLMEAALETMQENVFSLPAMIETAKANAEEGLAKVREAMYKLREQEASYPTGLVAITRLARVFEQATGISIRREFGNVPASVSPEVDSAVYHLVQEALVNAFRHGRADRAEILLWRDASVLHVRMEDNGAGAENISDGIGLSGMRERIQGLRGSVSVFSEAHGFVVKAEIPLVKTEDE
jgi:signal transduction histidine kinase